MEPRNERLWKLARLRAKFKNNAITYLIINTMLIAIWYFTNGARTFFWPMFPLVLWGIGLAINYYQAYWDNGDSVQKEYEKLLREDQL
jgi:uncharacterized membrane protein